MPITIGIKWIHLVGSTDPDSNKFREHHFSGVVSADHEPDSLKISFVNTGQHYEQVQINMSVCVFRLMIILIIIITILIITITTITTIIITM